MTERDSAGDSKVAVSEALRAQCERRIGVLDVSFLCQSVSVLSAEEPLCVTAEVPVPEVMEKLRDNKIGCVLIVDGAGTLKGIFSERDYVIKVYGQRETEGVQISQFMTSDPVVVQPDVPIGYALNLMSQGGFRHLPLVDADGMPLGLISIKDVIDYIVSSGVDELLDFEVAEESP